MKIGDTYHSLPPFFLFFSPFLLLLLLLLLSLSLVKKELRTKGGGEFIIFDGNFFP